MKNVNIIEVKLMLDTIFKIIMMVFMVVWLIEVICTIIVTIMGIDKKNKRKRP